MKIFYLPDLGEGLPDAEIREWYISEGDEVRQDQAIVAMETAKAVVDVPAPYDGKITKLHGKPGDVIKTGKPLVEFAGVDSTASTNKSTTVAGEILSTDRVIAETSSVAASNTTGSSNIQATPAVRALARKLGVNLALVAPVSASGIITAQDVELAKQHQQTLGEFFALTGVRRAMVDAMTKSHAQVVPAAFFDDADLHAWAGQQDVTYRLVRAITRATSREPMLNAWFEPEKMGLILADKVNLGIAMDSEAGLFMPVIHDAAQYDSAGLRTKIIALKEAVKNRTLQPDDLRGHTITLSNFGMFSGRFALPVVTPPTVCIIASGKMRKQPVVTDAGQIEAHMVLPLSLTFDHRAVTGGAASRFLGALLQDLASAE